MRWIFLSTFITLLTTLTLSACSMLVDPPQSQTVSRPSPSVPLMPRKGAFNRGFPGGFVWVEPAAPHYPANVCWFTQLNNPYLTPSTAARCPRYI
jgi:hypothetical protein